MEIFQLNPNDINEEGISVDIYDQNKRLIHGAAMKIVCRNDETDEGDIFNPRLLERAYKIVFALNLGMQQLEKIK